MSHETSRIIESIFARLDRSQFEDLIPDRPCDEVLTSYLEGALDPRAARELERALDQHPALRLELEDARTFLRDAPDVLGSATSRNQARPLRATRRRSAAALFAGAIACMAAGGQLWSGQYAHLLKYGEALANAGNHPNAEQRQSALFKVVEYCQDAIDVLERNTHDGLDAQGNVHQLARNSRTHLYRLIDRGILALSEHSTRDSDRWLLRLNERLATHSEIVQHEVRARGADELEQALLRYDKAEQRYLRRGDQRGVARVKTDKACALFALDRPLDALDEIDRGIAIYTEVLNDNLRASALHSYRGYILYSLDRTHDATAAILEAAARFKAVKLQ